MKITFLGAARTVTGSKYLIEHDQTKILVDCGLFQGLKRLRLRNWDFPPINPQEVNVVILTHAHIDHSGYLPLLVKKGFKGKVFCSEGTFDLCSILLPDSGYLQEEDARRANKYGYTKHHPAVPLYTEKDARRALESFQTVPYGNPTYLGDELHFTLSRAGHILGSSLITLSDGDKSIVFSGDLGRPNDQVMRPPATLEQADYIVIESTYGDRRHGTESPEEALKRIITQTSKNQGTVVIPAFAVGRAQAILYYLYRLKQAKEIPDLPIYLDSPMATNATKLMCKHLKDHRLPKDVCHDVCGIAKYVRTVEESKKIDQSQVPSIIISASGMATGGRILHHLKSFMSDHRNTILFTGYQAPGTRGDRMVKGEKEIKIHGDYHPVRAKVESLSNTSAHADYEEVLDWLGNFKSNPRKVFVTHGEFSAADSLKGKIQKRFNWDVMVPDYMDLEDL